MYCPACGKEILSDTKFCPQCGKVLDVASGVKNQPKRRNHPTLATFLSGLVVLVLHIVIIGANSTSKKDVAGINIVFGLLYFFLFLVFLATLSRRPKESVAGVDKNASTVNLKNQEKKHSGAGKWIIAIILILALPAFFIYGNSGLANPAVITAFVVVILGFFVWIIWRFFKEHREGCLRSFHTAAKTVKYLVHHPKLTIISSVVCVIIILFIYSVIVQSNYKSLENALPKIQDSLSEAATIKLMGDSIIDGRGVSNMWMGKIAKTTQTTSSNLKQLPTSGMLKSYKVAAIDWSDSIAKAAANTTTWKNLSEDPPVFTLNLNNNKVNEYIETSLQKVALLREAGDVAIKRKDRQTMYYIAGQLLVQEHWLDGIMHSTNPGILGFRIKLFSPVLAWFPGPANRVWQCNSRSTALRCNAGANPVDLVNKIRRSAERYAEAQPGADEQWNQVTADQLKVPTNQGQYTDTKGGVYNGEPNLPPQLSQAEKNFVDQCKAKGGTTGGTGGVYARMPTTETGIACHHGNSCWDYLTRTSRRYSGGNQGCPEDNLLPPPPPPTAAPKPTRKPAQPPERPQEPGQPTQPPQQPGQPTQPPPQNVSWDGVYNVRQSGSCGASGLGDIYSGISSDTITVQNNRVSVPNWGSATINSSGDAQLSYNMSYSGVGVSGRQTFHFYNSGGRAAVQGTMNMSAAGVGCQINFSGSRQ